MRPKKKQGFASFSPEKLREVTSRGGKKSGIRKGFATLSPEERSRRASEASKERWRRVKEARQNEATEV